MRKLFLAAMLMFSTPSFADYTFIVPQRPGSGTTIWAEIVARELEPFLGEKIIIKNIPGARDIPGFNEFHNELQYDDKTIMVSHGGNGVAFLQEKVDYNYFDYTSIGLMNLNIITAIRKDYDPQEKIKFSAGSGQTPEAYAMTMLLCGPNLTVDEYIKCFKENVVWVKGMKGGERRLAFKRGELNATRENPAAFKKHVVPDENAELWFHHGILQPDGSHADDPNYPNYQFEILFEKWYGVKPEGDFYDAYKLVKSFRDGLQKALWVRKDNPNAKKLQEALREMSKDPKATKAIQKKVGNYEWLIGEDGNAHRDMLITFINEEPLQTLVKFNKEALGLKSMLKELASLSIVYK